MSDTTCMIQNNLNVDILVVWETAHQPTRESIKTWIRNEKGQCVKSGENAVLENADGSIYRKLVLTKPLQLQNNKELHLQWSSAVIATDVYGNDINDNVIVSQVGDSIVMEFETTQKKRIFIEKDTSYRQMLSDKKVGIHKDHNEYGLSDDDVKLFNELFEMLGDEMLNVNNLKQ